MRATRTPFQRLIRQLLPWLLLGIPLAIPAVAAVETPKSIRLYDAEGRAIEIGQLILIPDAGGGSWHYRLQIDPQPFRDHFLSMKELKCLEGPELWCRVPYPYANPQRISRDDLRWLEHDLLFLFKRPDEFGARFWNGIYYRLHWDGDTLRGSARAVDLDLLAAPPDDLDTPPLGGYDIGDSELGERWLPRLGID